MCDNFNLNRFGVVGWDSFMTVITSSNLRGDNIPVVTVLSHNPSQNNPRHVVRAFELRGADWAKIFEKVTEPFVKTERLGAYDLLGDGIPTLVWLTRNDGTGSYLNVSAYRYNASAGMAQVFDQSGLYKGNVQIGVGNIVLFQPILKANEANCCPTGYNRMGFQWTGLAGRNGG